MLIDAEKLNIDVIDPILKTITEAQAKVTNSFRMRGPPDDAGCFRYEEENKSCGHA